jgi:hypothetical protein
MMRAFLMLGFVLYLLSLPVGTAVAEEGRADTSLRKGETRETLDPAFFSDTVVRRAYETAKEIPWVLDSIYCYCRCKESPVFRHKSLLSCYVDLHAST